MEMSGMLFSHAASTIGDDGDTLNLYYGAADTSIGLATGSIKEILTWLKDNSFRLRRTSGLRI